MIVLKKLMQCSSTSNIRQCGTINRKLKVVPDENVINNINNNVFKPRKHPGIVPKTTIALPDAFVKAVFKVIENYPVKALLENSVQLNRHLHFRVPPMEREEINARVEQVREKVALKFKDVVIKSEEEQRRLQQKITNKVDNILNEKIYNWKPLNYNTYNSLVYLMGRAAPEYAVLMRILTEINERDAEFQPRSVFDFGSGVGTATWAVNNFWKGKIFEYYNVDASSDMNDLSYSLLNNRQDPSKLKGVFYRQFLPAANRSYDLVISAYSMLELPSLETRLETALNLWNKTQDYLVIVEQGTNAGFKVVNEIRDFLLQIEHKNNVGHIFSPCPHDNPCPRFLIDDGTPCNFFVNYSTMPVGANSEILQERYSYVVLKKGKRSESDEQWPRIVRSTLVRSRHTICRMCTNAGKLDEVIFTASKHGKALYHCARSSNWGDRLPIKVSPQESDESNQIK